MSVERTVPYFQSEEFRDLTSHECQLLAQASQLRHFKKGQVLFTAGDERTTLYFVIAGFAKLERFDEANELCYLDFMNQGTLFPKVGLFTHDQHFYSAVAGSDIELLTIPMHVYEDVVEGNKKQLKKLIQLQSDIIKDQSLKIQKGMLNNSQQKIIVTLALLFNRLSTQETAQTYVIEHPITLTDVAKASGVSRETTAHIMKQLVHARRIDYRNKRLTFIDLAFFADVLEEQMKGGT